MYSWILVLVVLMVGGGNGGKRRRSSAQQEEEAGSEYNPAEDSGRDSQGEDLEEATEQAEVRSKRKEQTKGKGKRKEKGKGQATETGEQQTYIRGRNRTGGISIQEPGADSPPRAAQVPIDPKRVRMYASKHCVGERQVGVVNLCEKVPGFRALYDGGNLHEICDFPEQTGFGIELIREFYMRAGHLTDTEGGPYSFTTSVRGVQMLVTPDIIGNVLETPAYTGGYNIMPLANTKVIRWDRVLYMYLLGRPDVVEQRGINLNIPFLIWKRMAREIKTANKKDRLPYPLLIMRILRLHDVDVGCSTYERSLGPISDATIAKSHIQLHLHSPPQDEPPAPPSPPPAGSETEASPSISSVYREQQRLSGDLTEIRQDVVRLHRRYGRISRLLRLLCTRMGCGSSEMPPPGSDSE